MHYENYWDKIKRARISVLEDLADQQAKRVAEEGPTNSQIKLNEILLELEEIKAEMLFSSQTKEIKDG